MTQWSRLPKQWYSMAAAHPGSVLLETSRCDPSNRRSFLFLEPARILSASKLDEIPGLFQEIEKALDGGFHVAGFVGYECGYHFQSLEAFAPALSPLPLAWFGVYRSPLIFDHEPLCASHQAGRAVTTEPSPSPVEEAGDTPGGFQNALLRIPEDEYCARVERIQDYIRAGDTYQVNFTDFLNAHTSLSAAEAFAVLSRSQPVAYSALLHLAGCDILSLSPELFFRVEDGRMVTRPMKGTMPRGLDSAEDLEAALRLRNDEKNRAEHVMIVDLLRNDLGRICATGSIQVEEIFSVEKYRTLFQMTSTISGTLLPGLRYYDIFRSIFPGGSVTGAPKIRTMQIIREMEEGPRGVYTGAIGFIAPDRSSAFNLAIRTVVLENGHARMGVGGGIVADSRPADEYRECMLKAEFLTRRHPEFQLLETLLWDDEFFLLSMHLDRMESSASYFEFPFDRASVTSRMTGQSNRFLPGKRYLVRLLLDSRGQVTITTQPYLPGHWTGCVRLSPERTSSADLFLRHKTTYRDRYNRMYAECRAGGFDEIIFLNERGEVTEGAISNVFLRRNGMLHTPPLRSGVLPGTFRRHLLETEKTAVESVLTVEDLESAEDVFLCNSVRGMRRVKSLGSEAPLAAGLAAR